MAPNYLRKKRFGSFPKTVKTVLKESYSFLVFLSAKNTFVKVLCKDRQQVKGVFSAKNLPYVSEHIILHGHVGVCYGQQTLGTRKAILV